MSGHGIDSMGALVKSATAVLTLFGLIFAGYLFLDDEMVNEDDESRFQQEVAKEIALLHSKIEESAIHAEAEAIRQAKISDSTRAAQIIKYYIDVQKERALFPSEQARLDLMIREQQRLTEALK